ncbi:MAG: pre-peptidase C-terminal domain-containing protein [Anaerolineae bacterium]
MRFWCAVFLAACALTGVPAVLAQDNPPADAPVLIVYGTPVSGQITDASPRAAYEFDGLRGEVITLTVTVTDGSLDPILTVIDEDGNPLAVRDDGGSGRDLRLEFVRLPRSARYNVIVGRFGYNLGTTSGSFEVEIIREGVSFASGSALRYGDSVYNTITDMTPQVYYTFRAQRGDVITVRMQRISGDLDALLQVVNNQGFVIAENDDVVGSGSLDAQITALGIQDDGMYAIVASRFGQAAGRSRGSFVLTIETAAQSGLGASAEFSIPLTFDFPAEGEITNDRSAIFYQFSGRRDEIVSLTMNRVSGNLDTFIALTDATLQELITDDDGGGGQNSAIRDFVLPADGVYTVIATRYQRASGSTEGRYALTVTSAGSAFDGVQPNALRMSYGSTVTGRIDDSAPEVLYVFYGRAGDAITVSMSRADGDLDPLLTLLDANLTPLSSDDDSGSGQDARIERYTLPQTGLYYIRAERFGGSPLPTRGGYILVLAKLAN